jgi:two-component system, OmpR family, sensor histidine kinase KdpD
MQRERRPVAVLVQAALDSLGTLLSRHPVEQRIAVDLPPVSVDPQLVERVFTSLFGNVAKHTPAGTQVVVEAHVEGGRMQVSIEDTGPGLPGGREEEVFESFSRGQATSVRKGAGLGLAISKAIVEAHGGTIRAERGRERGARFIVTLPLAA